MGRPPLTPEQRKASMFSVRLTAEERALVDAAATAAGYKKPSKWARQVLLDAAARSRPTP
jgi:hypothetical protein